MVIGQIALFVVAAVDILFTFVFADIVVAILIFAALFIFEALHAGGGSWLIGIFAIGQSAVFCFAIGVGLAKCLAGVAVGTHHAAAAIVIVGASNAVVRDAVRPIFVIGAVIINFAFDACFIIAKSQFAVLVINASVQAFAIMADFPGFGIAVIIRTTSENALSLLTKRCTAAVVVFFAFGNTAVILAFQVVVAFIIVAAFGDAFVVFAHEVVVAIVSRRTFGNAFFVFANQITVAIAVEFAFGFVDAFLFFADFVVCAVVIRCAFRFGSIFDAFFVFAYFAVCAVFVGCAFRIGSILDAFFVFAYFSASAVVIRCAVLRRDGVFAGVCFFVADLSFDAFAVAWIRRGG